MTYTSIYTYVSRQISRRAPPGVPPGAATPETPPGSEFLTHLCPREAPAAFAFPHRRGKPPRAPGIRSRSAAGLRRQARLGPSAPSGAGSRAGPGRAGLTYLAAAGARRHYRCFSRPRRGGRAAAAPPRDRPHLRAGGRRRGRGRGPGQGGRLRPLGGSEPRCGRPRLRHGAGRGGPIPGPADRNGGGVKGLRGGDEVGVSSSAPGRGAARRWGPGPPRPAALLSHR